MLKQAIVCCLAMMAAATGAFAQTTTATAAAQPMTMMRYDDEALTAPFTLKPGKYGVFHTTDGDFIVDFYEKRSPNTVENFIGLATGQKRWTHPITLAPMTTPLYNNTTIYEIVKDIMILGGDPINKGTAGPGFNLEPENNPEALFDTAGILAMQSSGKQAHGSRWFVSLSPFPDYAERFNIVGRVVGGLDVVREMSRKPTKRPRIPLEPTVVNSIEIIEIPEGKEATASFRTENDKRVLTLEKELRDALVEVEDEETSPTDATTTETVTTTPTATAAQK